MGSDYDYDYGSLLGDSSGDSLGTFAALGSFMIVFWLITMVISVLMIVSYWKIFKKCGKPGWYILVPFLNFWTMLEIVGMQGWLSLIPGVNGIAMIISYFKLSEKLGKGKGFGIVLLLFPYVGFPMLAFSKDGGNSTQSNYQQPQYTQPVEQPQYTQPVEQPQFAQPVEQPQYTQPVEQPQFAQPVEQPQIVQPVPLVGESTTKICSNCGSRLDASATTCFLCGQKLN